MKKVDDLINFDNIPGLEMAVRELRPGDAGYTFPWAVSFNEKRQIFLNTVFPIRQYPYRSADLLVERFGSRRTDYIIYVTTVKVYRWKMGRIQYINCEKSDVVHIGTISEEILNKILLTPSEESGSINGVKIQDQTNVWVPWGIYDPDNADEDWENILRRHAYKEKHPKRLLQFSNIQKELMK